MDKILKRVFDYSLAFLGLFIFSPLWLIFTLTIWLEDKGPVYYTQDRVGKNSKLFKGIKFRSMIPDAESGLGPVQAKENDPRLTKIGSFLRKTAMDELPQLINILKGDMSFVGPRALRLKEKEVHDNVAKSIFDFPDFKLRSQLRPGLTGVAQVFGARDLIRHEKFQYDIWYIRNQNFSLDLYLIILSFLVTLRSKWETREDKFSFLGSGLKKKIEKEISGSK